MTMHRWCACRPSLLTSPLIHVAKMQIHSNVHTSTIMQWYTKYCVCVCIFQIAGWIVYKFLHWLLTKSCDLHQHILVVSWEWSVQCSCNGATHGKKVFCLPNIGPQNRPINSNTLKQLPADDAKKNLVCAHSNNNTVSLFLTKWSQAPCG